MDGRKYGYSRVNAELDGRKGSLPNTLVVIAELEYLDSSEYSDGEIEDHRSSLEGRCKS